MKDVNISDICENIIVAGILDDTNLALLHIQSLNLYTLIV